MTRFRGVAQLVARDIWDVEAAGSNPVTPTNPKLQNLWYQTWNCSSVFEYQLLTAIGNRYAGKKGVTFDLAICAVASAPEPALAAFAVLG